MLPCTEQVQLSDGSRHFAGGQMRLFELSHAAIPAEPPTIFTAKEGMVVSFGAEDVEGQASFLGRLVKPTRLGDKAGTRANGTATLVPDPDVVSGRLLCFQGFRVLGF